MISKERSNFQSKTSSNNDNSNNIIKMTSIQNQQKRDQRLNKLITIISCLGLVWVICSIIILTTSTLKVESSLSLHHYHQVIHDDIAIADRTSKSNRNSKEPNNLRDSKDNDLQQILLQPKYDKSHYYSKLPLAPSLQGAKKSTIKCDMNVNDLVYWNDPQGTVDVNFKTPFISSSQVKYISFEPDRGGWNNIRMSMEIMFIIAVATNRTLVLPPDQPLYLLDKDKKKKHRGFGDFFPLNATSLHRHVPVITMEEFIKREGGNDGLLPIVPSGDGRKPWLASETFCMQKPSERKCGPLKDHLRSVAYVPKWKGEMNGNCLIFDVATFHGASNLTSEQERLSSQFCARRKKVFYTSKLDESKLLHFQTSDPNYRLLDHFYMFIHFTDPKLDNYFKRFIRDYLHYNDLIFCTAGKIIYRLQQDISAAKNMNGYVSMHIRRGDFQYHDLKPTSQQIHTTIMKDKILLPNDVIYIATDERNKTFFDFFVQHNYTVKFLDDYWTDEFRDTIDPNYMGMIDTIIASYGREFIGTYCSTFTGYINRLRGYIGYSMKHSWFSTLQEKNEMQQWPDVFSYQPFYKEWPNAWVRIDGDDIVSKHDF